MQISEQNTSSSSRAACFFGHDYLIGKFIYIFVFHVPKLFLRAKQKDSFHFLNSQGQKRNTKIE